MDNERATQGVVSLRWFAGTQRDGVEAPGLTDRSQPPSDADLLAGVARGDPAAFRLIVERHHARTVRSAMFLLGDRDLAGEAAQEVFLRIHKSAARFRGESRLTSFLYAILRNVAREILRRERRHRARSVYDLAPSEHPQDPSNPAVELERWADRQALFAALAALPEKLRIVFVMSEIEGVPYREIAAVCGCRVGTVASRKHEAMRRLRAALGPSEERR